MDDPTTVADVIASAASGASQAAQRLGDAGLSVRLEDFSVEVTTDRERGVVCTINLAIVGELHVASV